MLVSGASYLDDVQWTAARLMPRCAGDAACRANTAPSPDPAFALKARFAKNAPALDYRTQVTWFDCSANAASRRLKSAAAEEIEKLNQQN